MSSGKFDIQKGTFTFTNPETGKEWSNYLINDLGYVMGISHQGHTYSHYVNENAIKVALNAGFEYLYIRDVDTKKYWNISGFPSLNEISNYKCEHGQQYTKISSECGGIEASITYAIAKDDTREVWEVTIQNHSEEERHLDVFATMNFNLDGFPQSVYYSGSTTSATEFLSEAQAVFCRSLNPNRPHERTSGYIMSSEPVFAYEGNLQKFVGTMGTATKPILLEQGRDCSNSTACVRPRAGILQNRVSLAAGESKTLWYVLGLIETQDKLCKSRKEFVEAAPQIIQDAIQGEGKFGHLRTVCPEPQFNHIMNYWAEHQVSYCMIGKKAVRDNAQLAMAMLNFNLDIAKKTIDECVVHQYSDGHAVLTWYPYLEPNIYSDPSVWLIFAICEYVKESGDFDYLNQKMAYLDQGEATVYEHLKQAIAWFEREDNFGEHHLPKIHHADWNDALNIPDKNAESVFLAMLICKAYLDVIALAEYIQDTEYAEQMKANKAKLAKQINETAYNGEYYVRAFSKFGVVGDKSCQNGGKIYVNPQSWSILSEVCPDNRMESVIAAIDGMETEEGIPLCSPSYSVHDESVGRMSSMLPGVYENGGIYNHGACFKVMADCRLGRGDHAVSTLKKIVPDGEYNPSSHTTTEPYVFTNCYLKHPSVDMMVGFSWQTGSSAWGLMCYYEGILGIRRYYDGIHMEPVFPKEWKKAEAQRYYRGNQLSITYINHGGDRVSLEVDGKTIEGNVVPLFDDEDSHTIVVTLQ